MGTTELIFLNGHTEKINKTLKNMGSEFVYIGFLLWEVQKYKYYEGQYNNLIEYAEDNFGFNKSSTYRFISICERFSTKSESGNPTMFLDKKFEGYSISQLGEILPLSDEDIEKLSPDMTIKQIREFKRSLSEQEKKVPMSGKLQISSFVKENINNLFEDSKQIDNFFKYAIDSGIIDKFLNEFNNKIDEEAQTAKKSNVKTIEDYPQISVEEVKKPDPKIKVKIENWIHSDEINYEKIKREIQKHTKNDVDILDIYDLVDEKGINKIRLYLKNASQFEGKLLNAIKKEFPIEDKGDN